MKKLWITATVRLEAEDRAMLDRLIRAMPGFAGAPPTKSQVLRLALRRLAEAEGVAGPEEGRAAA